MKWIIVIIACFLCSPVWTCSLDNVEVAYKRHDYQSAIDQLNKQLKDGCASFSVYYNLGNSHLQLDDIGNAILNYERALKIRPTDKDIQYNLHTANLRKVDQFKPVSSLPLLNEYKTLRDRFNSEFWGFLSIGTMALFVVLLLCWMFLSNRKFKKWSFICSFPVLIATVLFVLTAIQRSNIEHGRNYAIVTHVEAPLQRSPDTKSPPTRQVHAGTKMRILNRTGVYNRVELPNGERGWLKSDTHKII